MLRELESFCRERRSLFYPKTDLPLPDAVLRGLGAAAARDAPRYVAAAADVCRRLFGVEPAEVRPLGESGTFHALCRARLADGRSVVARFNALGRRGRDFLLHLDAWAAGLLRGAGLPALTVYNVDLSRTQCPYDVEVIEEARGASLRTFDADEERTLALLPALGSFVARMHKVRTHGFGLFDVRPLALGEDGRNVGGSCASWRDYVVRRLETHVERCAALGAVRKEEARRIFAAFAAAEDLLADVQPCLLHGDLGSHNVFVDGEEVTALIDWEDCLSGDPAFDVAFWATFHPDRRHRAFLDGYRRERPLSADFGRRFWLYYLRVALSKTVLRHRLGVADALGRAPASLRIQKGLERFEASEPLAA